jgi:uncharacterized protein DUF3471
LMYKVFDLYAGKPSRDWSADLRALFTRRTAAGAGPTRPANASPPSLPLERYAGTYADSTYGAVEITFSNGVLHARFGHADLGTLEPWQYETFRSHGPPPAEDASALTFVPDGAGGVSAVRVLGVLFSRLPARTR